MDGRDFSLAALPVPVREDVRHREVGTPARLEEPEGVLPESGLVEEARVAGVYSRAR